MDLRFYFGVLEEVAALVELVLARLGIARREAARASIGRGERTGVFGAYLCACLDADTGDLQSVCKIGTGFSDEDLKTLDAQARAMVLPAKPRHVKCGDALEHDITWIEPKLVWEVQVADLSLSDTHKGALGRVKEGRGIGLRFPRLLRSRDDKGCLLYTSPSPRDRG